MNPAEPSRTFLERVLFRGQESANFLRPTSKSSVVYARAARLYAAVSRARSGLAVSVG
jgi:hypothetical protein